MGNTAEARDTTGMGHTPGKERDKLPAKNGTTPGKERDQLPAQNGTTRSTPSIVETGVAHSQLDVVVSENFRSASCTNTEQGRAKKSKADSAAQPTRND